jgi:hypothetical protein
MANHKDKLVEITRSFTYKLNLGNYQTADFFCSQKAEVPEKEAKQKSKELYKFCAYEVLMAVKNWMKKHPKAFLKWDEVAEAMDSFGNEGKHKAYQDKEEQLPEINYDEMGNPGEPI